MYANIHVSAKVGQLQFNHIHSFEANFTFRELTQTATLELPRNFYVNGEKVDNVRKFFKEKDYVEVNAGYNGELHTVFKGYIREIEPSIPIKLTLEDDMLLMKGKPIKKSWSSKQGVKLQALLEFLLSEYQLSYEVDALDWNLGSFMIDRESASEVLKNLKKDYGIYAYFKDNKLHAGFAFTNSYNQHQYHFQKNVKDRGDLKYVSKESFPVKVTAISHQRNGKTIKVELPKDAPENASLRTLNYGHMSLVDLTKTATADLKKFNIDGYRGGFKAFGIPQAMFGDVAVLEDARYPETNGSYLIEAVRIRIGSTFYERQIKLGEKVSGNDV